jgi:hypothetical protein
MDLNLMGTKPSWSPDGQQIVFESNPEIRIGSDSTNYEATDIYRTDVNGSNLTKLGDDSVVDIYRSPAWSPNGKYIAFWGLKYGENQAGLYIMSPEGHAITLLYKEPDILAIHEEWVWSPDSKKIVFSMGSPVHSPYGEIYLLDLDANEPVKLISDPEINIQPSWREITDNQSIPDVTEEPTERSPELTLQPTTQSPSQQSSSRASYYFYIFGYIFTSVCAITTVFMLVWLARRRGYPVGFFAIGISVLLVVLVLVLIGIYLRKNSPLGSNREPAGLPTPISTVISSPTLDITETSIINAVTESPTPEQTIKRAEISCQNEIFFVSLRSTPGIDPANKIVEIPCGETVDLLGPSQEANGLTWWNVSWNGYEGWIADHTQSGKVVLLFDQ